MWVEIEVTAFKLRRFRVRHKRRKRTASKLYQTLRNEEPHALPCHRRVARNTWQKPFCLFIRFSSPLRASRELRRTRRSPPGGMSKVFALIINSLFSALPTHKRSPGAIRLSKKSLLRISTVELPITPTSYSSPSSHLLLQNPSQSGAFEAHGWSLFSEPRIIAFRQMPQFQLCECTGWEPAFARPIVFVLGLRDAFAYSLHWCVVQSRCEKANLVRRAALAAALSRRGCRARRPPVMLLYLLNNACKHSGNAFSSRSIVVISHVGSLPPFAFSSSAAVAGRPGGSGSGRV